MSQRWVAVSRIRHGVEMHLPELGLRLKTGTRTHRKFVLREFRSAGMTDYLYTLAFQDVTVPVHTAFEQSQDDLGVAMRLFEDHPDFLSWHMLMTNGILDWNIVQYPPFAEHYPRVAARVSAHITV